MSATGIKPCLTCTNLVSIEEEHLQDTLCVPLSCPDYNRFIQKDNDTVYRIADELKDLHDANHHAELKRRTKLDGLKHVPNGLLYCPELRAVFKPVDHFLRDWMHVLVSNGVCNRELGLLLHVIVETSGITLEFMRNFITKVTLPKKHGKAHPEWLSPKRLQDDFLQ